MTFPPETLPTNRLNTTPTTDTHPKDHNDANAAVNAIVERMGLMPVTVHHENDPDVERPSNAGVVFWFGSVHPNNMIAPDVWFELGASPGGGDSSPPPAIDWLWSAWAGDVPVQMDGLKVAGWGDFSQPIVAEQPIFVVSHSTLNNRPAIVASDHMMATPYLPIADALQSYSIFMVLSVDTYDGESDVGRMFDGVRDSSNLQSANYDRIHQDTATDAHALRFRSTGSHLHATVPRPAETVPVILTTTHVVGSGVSIRINGTPATIDAQTTTQLTRAHIMGERRGRTYESPRKISARYGFVGVKSGAFTTQERSDLEVWASVHYEMPLA